MIETAFHQYGGGISCLLGIIRVGTREESLLIMNAG